MNTQNEDRDFVQIDWLDPFPEPHTIPSGWDISGLFSFIAGRPAPDDGTVHEQRSERD